MQGPTFCFMISHLKWSSHVLPVPLSWDFLAARLALCFSTRKPFPVLPVKTLVFSQWALHGEITWLTDKDSLQFAEAVVTFTVKKYNCQAYHACFSLFIKNYIICNRVGFRISLPLSREGAMFRDKIENYFSYSHLARRDRDYHMIIFVFRDENEITYCYSHVSRQNWDFRKSFLVVEREKMKLTLVENSWDREFSLTSAHRSRVARTRPNIWVCWHFRVPKSIALELSGSSDFWWKINEICWLGELSCAVQQKRKGPKIYFTFAWNLHF